MLVLVRHMHINNTKSKYFFTCISHELRRRRLQWWSRIPVPEPFIRLFAHNRQSRTCVHFHGGFCLAKRYCNFYRLGSLGCRVVERVHDIPGIICSRLKMAIVWRAAIARGRFQVSDFPPADGCKMSLLFTVVAR